MGNGIPFPHSGSFSSRLFRFTILPEPLPPPPVALLPLPRWSSEPLPHDMIGFVKWLQVSIGAERRERGGGGGGVAAGRRNGAVIFFIFYFFPAHRTATRSATNFPARAVAVRRSVQEAAGARCSLSVAQPASRALTRRVVRSREGGGRRFNLPVECQQVVSRPRW